MPTGLAYVGHSPLGGTNEAFLFENGAGHRYLLKVDGSDTQSRAEEAASNVGGAVLGYEYLPPVWFASTARGTGSLQPIVPNEGQPSREPGLNFFKKYAEQLVAHQTLDWLVGNHDSHGQQFLFGINGKLVACDKGQAFQRVGADKLSYEYAPNAQFGEAEPVYNQMWKHFILAELDVGFDLAKVVLAKMQQLSDDDYVLMIRSYINARARDGKASPVEITNMLLDRKNATETDMQTFWKTCQEQRKQLHA